MSATEGGHLVCFMFGAVFATELVHLVLFCDIALFFATKVRHLVCFSALALFLRQKLGILCFCILAMFL